MNVERIPREDDGGGLDPTIDRAKQIHASDVAAILGLSPYSSPLQAWLEKTGRAAPRVESRYARLGKHLEGAVADMYEEETGLDLLDPRETLVCRSVPLAGTPDRYAYSKDSADVDRIVEIKTAWTWKTANAWGEPGTDQVPEHYRCQGIVYLALSGIKRLDYALLANGDLKTYTLWHDETIAQRVFSRLSAWWQTYVAADRQPEATHPTDGDAIKHLWSDTSGAILDVGTQFDEVAKEYVEATALAKSASDAADVAKARLQAAIADADGLEGSTFRATWRFAKMQPRVDWESVATRCGATPDIVKEYTTDAKPSRRFQLKEK